MNNLGTSSLYAWVDLETSGLDVYTNDILEVAVIITDSFHFNEIERLHIIVHQKEEVFTHMNSWCQKMHRKPRRTEKNKSLVDLCRASTVSLAQAERLLAEFLDKYRENRWVVACGSSVQKDVEFLKVHMPSMKGRLHYRTIDVSSILEVTKRMYPGLTKHLPPSGVDHTAMADIESSFKLFRWLTKNVFVPQHYSPMKPHTVASTIRWGFDAVGGMALLRFSNVTNRGPSKISEFKAMELFAILLLVNRLKENKS